MKTISSKKVTYMPRWLQALSKVLDKMDKSNLYYPRALGLFQRAKELIEISQRDSAQFDELLKSSLYQNYFEKTRMYLKHFVVALSMMVERGEISIADCSVYKFPEGRIALPDIESDYDLDKWCRRIIEGEEIRVRTNQNERVYNPSSIQLKAVYDNFSTYYQLMQTERERCKNSQLALADICVEVNNFLAKLN